MQHEAGAQFRRPGAAIARPIVGSGLQTVVHVHRQGRREAGTASKSAHRMQQNCRIKTATETHCQSASDRGKTRFVKRGANRPPEDRFAQTSASLKRP